MSQLWQDLPPFQHRKLKEPYSQGGACEWSEPVEPPVGPGPADYGWPEASGGVGTGSGQGAFCKYHHAIERGHKERGKTAQLPVAAEEEDAGNQQEAGDGLADERGGYFAGKRNGVTVSDAVALMAPKQEGKGAQDGADQLGQNIAKEVSGEHPLSKQKRETDDRVDVGAADPTDRRKGNAATGKAKQKAGKSSSCSRIGHQRPDGRA